jgi:two-component system response regulator PilR (NtrC family)
VDHFLVKFCRKLGKPPMNLTDEAMDVLRRHPFRGNVRELENLMERCVALNPGGPVGTELFPDSVLGKTEGREAERAFTEIPPMGFDLEIWLTALKGHLMLKALERCDGNKTRAARLLGMSFRAYRYWLQEMGGVETLRTAYPHPEAFPAKDSGEGDGDG